MEITLSENSGFCFGVKRAVDILNDELENNGRVFCLGEIIHNRIYIKSLTDRGAPTISPENIDDIPDNATAVIRTHGIRKDISDALTERGISFIDATCPYVKKIHKIVDENSADGSACIILGDKKHPEVEGIISYAHGECCVFSDPEEALNYIKNNLTGKKYFIVAQTTYNSNDWNFFSNNLKKLYTNSLKFDTICSVTENRQQEADNLSRKNDVCIIVGGLSSSNTKKLFEIASANCSKTFMIENADGLDDLHANIIGSQNTAIIAGASTPGDIIQEVYKKMSEITKDELTFGEMLDQSFKTLTTGERVKGVISAVNSAEIKVDLGTKHTGILPYDEIASDNDTDLERDYKVGDEIEVMCIKFSDSEGTVLLSKKRLEMPKNLEKLAQAAETGEILEGTVKEIVNKGVIVNIKGIRVFIPASHTGVKEESLGELTGKHVNLTILEYNAAKRRIVGSIKNAGKMIRQKDQDEFYSTAEIGQKFQGTVRFLADYGVFVNIGPVDGMVHISELSWGRLVKPSDILKVGDKIDVFIKSIDSEKGRISLGYKTEENNPWNIFKSTHSAGDKVTVKIVNIMPFGAFAEIIPGVDGLIHCSQIAENFVPNPASVLKIGDTVDVKITAVDEEKKRISLSIKELLDPSAEAVYETDVTEVKEAYEEIIENTPEIMPEAISEIQEVQAETTENTLEGAPEPV